MKTYLEIHVPVSTHALWFKELKNVFCGMPVKWQNGYFHITIAFIDDQPQDIDLRPIFEKHLSNATAPCLTFDKLDAFITASGTYIIYLTAKNIPESFKTLVENIRADIKATGCTIQSDFKLHVTLGRLNLSTIDLKKVQELVQSVSIPPFTLKLTDIDHRVFRGKTLFKTKLQ